MQVHDALFNYSSGRNAAGPGALAAWRSRAARTPRISPWSKLGSDDFDAKLDADRQLGALRGRGAVLVLRRWRRGPLRHQRRQVVSPSTSGDDFKLTIRSPAPLGSARSDARQGRRQQPAARRSSRGARQPDAVQRTVRLGSRRRRTLISIRGRAHAGAGEGYEGRAGSRDQAALGWPSPARGATRGQGQQLAAIATLSGSTDPDIYTS